MNALETERLRLRSWSERDLAPLTAFMASDASRFVGGPMSEGKCWRRMAMFIGHWRLRGFGPWVMEDKVSGRAAGYCGLWRPHGWPETEIAYCLFDGYRGKGLATEAVGHCRDHAFRDLGLPTIVSFIAAENVASQRVAERLGARTDGTTLLPSASGASPAVVWRYRPVTSMQPSTGIQGA